MSGMCRRGIFSLSMRLRISGWLLIARPPRTPPHPRQQQREQRPPPSVDAAAVQQAYRECSDITSQASTRAAPTPRPPTPTALAPALYGARLQPPPPGAASVSRPAAGDAPCRRAPAGRPAPQGPWSAGRPCMRAGPARPPAAARRGRAHAIGMWLRRRQPEPRACAVRVACACRQSSRTLRLPTSESAPRARRVLARSMARSLQRTATNCLTDWTSVIDCSAQIEL